MKSLFKYIDTFQIVTFSISAIVSLGLLVVTRDMESVTIGFVLAALFQTFDLQIRHNQSNEQLLQATTLSHSLFHDEWLMKHIRQIVNNYQSVDKSEIQREFFFEKARAAIEECASGLAGLSMGRFSTTREEQMLILEELMRTAHVQARGVSHIDFKEWWYSEIGRSYLLENEHDIRKGIHIIRIFIAPKDRIQELKELVIEQHNVGVEVWVAIQEEQPPELLESYVIFDESIVSKSQLILGGQFHRANVTADLYEVKRMINNFNWLLRNSRKAKDVFQLEQ